MPARRRLAITGVAAAILSLAVQGGAHATAAGPAPAPQELDEATAASLARQRGTRVEVDAKRTERDTLWANPDGTFTLDLSSVAVRSREDGVWTPVDTTLARRADGTVTPSSVPGDVELSGGGATPMLSIGRDRGRLDLTWPASLPVPSLDGPVATYRDVLPGVDLVLTVSPEAVSQVLVVRDRAAAANPALRRLTFGTRTSGLTLEERDGGYRAIAADGSTVLRGGRPAMWDSRGRALGGDNRHVAPAEGDKVAPMTLAIEPGSLAIVPDASLLAAPDTAFPLYIDPAWNASRIEWGMIDKTYPSNVYHNWTGDQGVGYQNFDGVSTKRLMWEFNTSGLNGKHVLSSTLTAYQTWSSTCTATPVDVYVTTNVSTGTTWNNSSSSTAWPKRITSKNTNVGRTGCDPDGALVAFTVTTAAVDAAAANLDVQSLGLRAPNELDNSQWKRFRPDITYSTTYNTVPSQPSATYLKTTNPNTTCVTGANRPWVGVNNPKVWARVVDGDGGNLYAEFEIRNLAAGSTPAIGRTYGASGSDFSYQLAARPDGSYTWRARGDDGVDEGAWSVSCEYSVDTVDPTMMPTVTSPTHYPENAISPLTLGDTGQFTVVSGGDTDIKYYKYAINSDPPSIPATPGTLSGPATISYTADKTGVNFLKVQSIDRAGNPGPTRTYEFTVEAGPAIAQWRLDEAAGATTAPDTGDATTKQPLTVSGSDWVDGVQAASYPQDRAIYHDSGADSATAASPTNWTKSWTVTAFVQPSTLSGVNAVGSPLRMNGVNVSQWRLSYEGTDWLVATRASDSTSSAYTATLQTPAVTDGWQHVAIVYDSVTKKLKLYFNGEFKVETTYTATWNPTGQFHVGGSDSSGYWLGMVDEVRVYPGALDDATVHQIAYEPYEL
ncbi:MAG TPA: LamG-like jellyroll fold domain-containing protein [Frankiaceae bacterium]|nr:LamG-like jellyroll fold domain-containing protein [Frankiaceae bacterium]